MSLRESLKAETIAARVRIEQAEELKRRREAAIAEELERQEKERAKSIIAKIPDLCSTAARKGENIAKVMPLEYKDFGHDHIPMGHRYATVDNLVGAAKKVSDYCIAEDLEVFVQDWHDGVGYDSGHDLNVRW